MKKGIGLYLAFIVFGSLSLQLKAETILLPDGRITCSGDPNENLGLNFLYQWYDIAPVTQQLKCENAKKKIEEGLKEPINEKVDLVSEIKSIEGNIQSFHGKPLCACLADQEGLSETDFKKVMGYIDSLEMLQLEANDLGFRHRAAAEAIIDFEKDPGDLAGRYPSTTCSAGFSEIEVLPARCSELKEADPETFEKIQHAMYKGKNQAVGSDQNNHNNSVTGVMNKIGDTVQQASLVVTGALNGSMSGGLLTDVKDEFLTRAKNSKMNLNPEVLAAAEEIKKTAQENEQELIALLLRYKNAKKNGMSQDHVKTIVADINRKLYSVSLVSYPYTSNTESKKIEIEVYRFLADLNHWEEKYKQNHYYQNEDKTFKDELILKDMLFHLKDLNRHNAGKFCSSVKEKANDLCARALKPERAKIDFDRYFTPLIKDELGENKSAIVGYDKADEHSPSNPKVENSNLSDAAAASNLLSLFPKTVEGQKLKLKMLKSACFKIDNKAMPEYLKAKDIAAGELSQKVKSLGTLEDSQKLPSSTDPLLQQEGAAITAAEGQAEKQKVEKEEKAQIDAVIKSAEKADIPLLPKTETGDIRPEHKAVAAYIDGVQKSGFNVGTDFRYNPSTNQFRVDGEYYDATSGEKTIPVATPIEEPKPSAEIEATPLASDKISSPALNQEELDVIGAQPTKVYDVNSAAIQEAAQNKAPAAAASIQAEVKGIEEEKKAINFNLTKKVNAKTLTEAKEAEEKILAAEKRLKEREERLAKQISELAKENAVLRERLRNKGFVDSQDQRIAASREEARRSNSGFNFQNTSASRQQRSPSFNSGTGRQIASLGGETVDFESASTSRVSSGDFLQAASEGKVTLKGEISFDFTNPDSAKVQASKEELQRLGLTPEDQKLIDDFTTEKETAKGTVYEIDTAEGKKSVLVFTPETRADMGYFRENLDMPRIININRASYAELSTIIAPLKRTPASSSSKALGEKF